MTNPTSTAHVVTDRPARYGKQLVSHLSRKVIGEWDEATGTGVVTFNDTARVAHLISADGALVMELTCPDDVVAELEDVLGRHLVRFGTRDELTCSWVRADGSPGTTQQVTEQL